MVNCTVESHYGTYIVTFEDGKTLLLQSDYDQAAFAVACGLVRAPDNWDGSPSDLGEAWENCEMTNITKCPGDYYNVVETTITTKWS
jgi:hypothetical protein